MFSVHLHTFQYIMKEWILISSFWILKFSDFFSFLTHSKYFGLVKKTCIKWCVYVKKGSILNWHFSFLEIHIKFFSGFSITHLNQIFSEWVHVLNCVWINNGNMLSCKVYVDMKKVSRQNSASNSIFFFVKWCRNMNTNMNKF